MPRHHGSHVAAWAALLTALSTAGCIQVELECERAACGATRSNPDPTNRGGEDKDDRASRKRTRDIEEHDLELTIDMNFAKLVNEGNDIIPVFTVELADDIPTIGLPEPPYEHQITVQGLYDDSALHTLCKAGNPAFDFSEPYDYQTQNKIRNFEFKCHVLDPDVLDMMNEEMEDDACFRVRVSGHVNKNSGSPGQNLAPKDGRITYDPDAGVFSFSFLTRPMAPNNRPAEFDPLELGE